MKCPHCQSVLVKQNYEGVQIDSCKDCQGSWLDENELTPIIEIRKVFFSPAEIDKTIKQRSFRLKESTNESRIPCPKCMKMMRTFNYAGDSGIILDRCNDGHGLWFDQGELAKVQMFREHWEKEANERGDAWVQMAKGVTIDKKRSFSPFQILVNFFFD